MMQCLRKFAIPSDMEEITHTGGSSEKNDKESDEGNDNDNKDDVEVNIMMTLI